jgi:formylglycine-generating enzyme required for sulfatase activity
VRAAEAIIVCLSQSSISKEGYVQKEIGYALDVAEEKPEGTLFIFPLKLEDCDIPPRLSRWQAGRLFAERGYERLVQALKIRADALGVPVLPIPKLAPIIRNSIGMEFILISAGEFFMGSVNGDDDENPVRKVQISQLFYLGNYPVTQAQWVEVMGDNPSRFKGDPNLPVEQVSWDDTQEFLKKLNAREHHRSYRLPTEAEWEYACRAGSTGAYCFGDDKAKLKEYAWYNENSGRATHPVGQLKPNAWGLYDMHGNVLEWVQDWYARDYYYKQRPNPDTNPQGPEGGEMRVLRGGSFWATQRDARCACRFRVGPNLRDDRLGFRIARWYLIVDTRRRQL